MVLKEKLHNVKMTKYESVTFYITRVAQVKDELAMVGETISDSELARIVLKGFTKEWEVFVKCIVGREKLLDWSKLWDDFTQEEIREGSLGSQVNEEVEHNVALAAKTIKKKKYISHIRCYHCGKMGHCSSKCLEKNNVKENIERDMVASTIIEDYAMKFEQEFYLVSIDSSVGSLAFENVWVVDNGATRHMTGIYDTFQIVTELGPRHFI